MDAVTVRFHPALGIDVPLRLKIDERGNMALLVHGYQDQVAITTEPAVPASPQAAGWPACVSGS